MGDYDTPNSRPVDQNQVQWHFCSLLKQTAWEDQAPARYLDQEAEGRAQESPADESKTEGAQKWGRSTQPIHGQDSYTVGKHPLLFSIPESQ